MHQRSTWNTLEKSGAWLQLSSSSVTLSPVTFVFSLSAGIYLYLCVCACVCACPELERDDGLMWCYEPIEDIVMATWLKALSVCLCVNTSFDSTIYFCLKSQCRLIKMDSWLYCVCVLCSGRWGHSCTRVWAKVAVISDRKTKSMQV